jgi:hypothetical protein
MLLDIYSYVERRLWHGRSSLRGRSVDSSKEGRRDAAAAAVERRCGTSAWAGRCLLWVEDALGGSGGGECGRRDLCGGGALECVQLTLVWRVWSWSCGLLMRSGRDARRCDAVPRNWLLRFAQW